MIDQTKDTTFEEETISDLINEVLDESDYHPQRRVFIPYSQNTTNITHRTRERVLFEFNLPYGGMTELSKRTSYTYNTLNHWRKTGIPKGVANEVCKAIEEVRADLERVFIDLPYGVRNKLSKKMGISYQTINTWGKIGFPIKVVDEVNAEIENIRQEKEQLEKAPKVVNLSVRMRANSFVTGYFGKLPHGALKVIAKEMGKSYGTVQNWNTYGIPEQHREIVRQAKERLGYD